MSVRVLLRPFVAAETYRTLVYLGAALPLGALELALLVAGWTLAACVAVTPLVVFAVIGLAMAVRGGADAERRLARGLLGVDVRRAAATTPRGLWRRTGQTLIDGGFWREQAFMLTRGTLGATIALGELVLIAVGAFLALAPFHYRWTTIDWGSWKVDTLADSFLVVPIGIAVLVAAFAFVRPLGALSRRLARTLLGPGRAALRPERARVRALGVHAALAGGIAALLTVIWAATSRGSFWPGWAIAPLAVPLAIHAWAVYVENRGAGWRRWRPFALHAGISAVIELYLIVVWAMSGGGYFWPIWPLLALAIAVGVHALVLSLKRPREEELTARIEQLETRRSGAVDVQDAELRRIERDLHDGAQARLVALGMSLGMAEQKLATDPEAARALLGEARRGASEALRELRDLARGIHPPVLTDRGLAAAIFALADRSAVPVRIEDGLAERPPAPVETAAYFVVAEALANAGKHSEARSIDVRLRREGTALVVEVEDDGHGGANATGGGLAALRRRVEAHDGTLTVTSPAGGPTVVQAELPCGS